MGREIGLGTECGGSTHTGRKCGGVFINWLDLGMKPIDGAWKGREGELPMMRDLLGALRTRLGTLGTEREGGKLADVVAVPGGSFPEHPANGEKVFFCDEGRKDLIKNEQPAK